MTDSCRATRASDNNMQLACARRDLKAVKYQCQIGNWDYLFKNDPDNLYSPFQLCCMFDYHEIIIFLLTQKSFPISSYWLRCSIRLPEENRFFDESSLFDGLTPLHIFCHHGCLPIVKMLCDRGAEKDILKQDLKLRRSPLMSACMSNNLGLCRYLVSKVAILGFGILTEYLNLRDKEGRTAAFWACRTGNIDVLHLLACFGSDLTIADQFETSLLLLSCENSDTKVVDFLLKTEASNVLKDDNYSCDYIFIRCCEIGHLPTFELLCDFLVNKTLDRQSVFAKAVPILISEEKFQLLRWLFKAHCHKGDPFMRQYVSPHFETALSYGNISRINEFLSVFDDEHEKRPHAVFKEYFEENALNYFFSKFAKRSRIGISDDYQRSTIRLLELGICSKNIGLQGLYETSINEVTAGRKFIYLAKSTCVRCEDLLLFQKIGGRIKESKIIYHKILTKLLLTDEVIDIIADYADFVYGESFDNLDRFLIYVMKNFYLPVRESQLRNRSKKTKIQEDAKVILFRLDALKRYRYN